MAIDQLFAEGVHVFVQAGGGGDHGAPRAGRLGLVGGESGLHPARRARVARSRSKRHATPSQAEMPHSAAAVLGINAPDEAFLYARA
jgi:hypothetical protein